MESTLSEVNHCRLFAASRNRMKYKMAQMKEKENAI